MESVWFLFWWCPLLSVDCFHKLCHSGTLPENSQVVRDLGNRMAKGCRFYVKWACPMGSYAWDIQMFLISRTESRNEVPPFFSNRTLEYLRHNFPWDRHISRKTITPSHPIPKIPTRLTIFWGGTWKTEFVKGIHRQERISSEKKSDGFHKKCSIELWTTLMFELLWCAVIQQCGARNEQSINYWKSIEKHYWF